MPPTIECKVGDVVAVEFPFADWQGQKRRPGLVLAADASDVLLARLTTHPPRGTTDVALTRWTEVGLPKPSTVRLTKLAAVDRRLIHHRIGRLHVDDADAILRAWQTLTASVTTGLRAR
jgi:mRNA-degrading endonuclease toxin of MazEF toxin-antitoxin module